MQGVNPEQVPFVLSKIGDGWAFEDFAQQFLAAVTGRGFVPIGGIHDQGMDGLERAYVEKERHNFVYQISISQDARSKIRKTITVLRKEEIDVARLYYVTNREVRDSFKIQSDMFEEFGALVDIYDVKWFKAHVNDSQGTVTAFRNFESTYLAEFQRPGKAFEILNVQGDPRVFVFLSQQFDSRRDSAQLEETLADSLILYALEGTDPNEGILRSRAEIIARISQITETEPEWLIPTIDKRLKVMSTKPRRIRHHRKEDRYCLPYETRLEIQDKNIADRQLYENFRASVRQLVAAAISEQRLEVDVDEVFILLEKVFHNLFRQQGLEFAEFVDTRDSKHSVEESLVEIVEEVVDGSKVRPQLRGSISELLVTTIRKIVYSGTTEQLEFLRRLANTYRMLFLLQCDPEVIKYFDVMTANLQIYVDNSIIIPALSEYYLDEKNRRNWNLLTAAHDAGVTLLVNEYIIDELVSHINITIRNFLEIYKGEEDIYEDTDNIQYVDQILIRAYFHAKAAGKVTDFDEFIGTFTAGPPNREDMILWLEDAFGVKYQSVSREEINIDPEAEEELYQALKEMKRSEPQARTDARQILLIYAHREKDIDSGINVVFGYRTWWLTTDTTTQRAWQLTVGRNARFRTSPYIRADFLYNFITLAPSRAEVDAIYERIFPTLLGVNISYHLPSETSEMIRSLIQEFHKIAMKPVFRARLKSLANKLKSEPSRTKRQAAIQSFRDKFQQAA